MLQVGGNSVSKGACVLGPSFESKGCIFDHCGPRADWVSQIVFGTRDSATGDRGGGQNLAAPQGGLIACLGFIGRAANIPVCESES